jgi:tetratricopeptide (TPR) repeat protein
VKSTQRHAAAAAGLLALVLSGAPLLAQQRGNQEPPQRGGPPNGDTPQILVAVLQSPDKGLGVQAADEIRRRIQVEHSAKELYAVPKQAINNTLEASGYRADSALNASDLMELAKQVHGDYVLEGKIAKSGNGVHLEARLLTRTGQQTLAQPLTPMDGKDAGDVAKQVEKQISDALKGMPAYKACTNDLRAQKYDQAVADARKGIAAYPNSTLNRLCILSAYNYEDKTSPDSVIAIADQILQQDPTSLIALNTAADAYKKKGNNDKAIEYNIRMWRVDPSNQSVVENIIVSLVNSGAPEKALPIIDTLLAQNPGDVKMLETKWHLQLAAADKGAQGMWKQAIATGEELAKVDTAKATLDYYQRMIGAAQKDSDAAKVQEFAAKAAQKFPKDASLQLLLAQGYLKSGQLQQALAAARRASEADPKDSRGWLFAIAVQNQMNQGDSALATAQKAIASGISKDTIGASLLATVGPALKKAQDSKAREDWQSALQAAQTVDAIASSPQTKFYIGVSAFQIGADAITNVNKMYKDPKQRAAACDEVKVAEDNFATAQVAMPAGGRVDPSTAGQIMQGITEYGKYIPQFKQALHCK